MISISENINKYIDILYVSAILFIFIGKYYFKMLAVNNFWQIGAWYRFLEQPSVVAQTGLLNPLALDSYYKTLSISLGHQAISKMYQFFGLSWGLSILYIFIAILFIIAVYALAYQISNRKYIAFFVALLITATDTLAMAHVGAVGHLGQGAVRDYLALVFFLFSVYFLFEHSYYLCWISFLIGFLAHLSEGLFVFIMLMPLIYLVSKNIKVLAFYFLSISFIMLGLYLYQSQSAVPLNCIDWPLWFKWCYIFNGGHIFWDHSIHYLIPTYTFFSVVIAGFGLACACPRQNYWVILLIITWLLIAVLASYFIYFNPMALIYKLTPLRSSVFLSSILLIIIFSYLVKTIFENNNIFIKYLASLAILIIIFGNFSGIYFISFITCLLLAISYNNWRKYLYYLLMSVICILFFISLDEICQYDNIKLFLKAGLVVTIIVSIYFLFNHLIIRLSNNDAFVFLISLLLIIGVLIGPAKYVSYPNQQEKLKLNEFLNISRIIKTHSQENEAVLMIPLVNMPYLETTANRGSIFQLPKAAFVYMAPKLLAPMNEALKDLGIDIASFHGTWSNLVREVPQLWTNAVTTQKINILKTKYNASCLLTVSNHILNLPILFQGEYFRLYSLSKVL